MRTAYLDCFAGISGDMLLGAILDAGAPLAELQRILAGLPLAGYTLSARPVTRCGIAATQAVVEVTEEQAPRTLGEVLGIVSGRELPKEDAERIEAVFHRLAEAEAKVHGETAETVHLHDVGAVDAIVDIVGAVVGLRLLGVEALFCSPLPVSGGEVSGSHGVLPLPAPATLELIASGGVAVRAAEGGGEMVTPTGAAIVSALATFERPEMTLGSVGYGAGSRDPADRANVLRLWLGEGAPADVRSTMMLIETNIDDMTPEMLGYAFERVMAAGAADAWFTPIQMKKNRPGIMLSVIAADADEERIARVILRETSTLGVRVRPVHRREAEREVLEFDSSLGPAAVKVKRLPGEAAVIAPEYESCKALAESSGRPLQEVYELIREEARPHLS
jgi:uncharacterized protein (TIGR00299 family) protein